MSGQGTESAIRIWAAERHLPASILARWLALAESDRDALLAFARRLNLRTGQFVAAFELLDEIKVRESASLAEVLRGDQLRQLDRLNLSGPGKAAAALGALRAIRFPQLRASLDRLTSQIADLKLPPGVKVILPPNLSSAELKVEVAAESAMELRQLIETLAAKTAGLCRIAEALGGTDEV